MIEALTSLSAERLREVLDYDPLTGFFTWKICRGRCSAGSRAGCRRSDGYVTIRVYGVQYLAHRLAWLWCTGDHPTGEIDHKNGVPGDDRFENLRDLSRSGNQQNQRKAQRSNSVGFLGVSPHEGKFRSRIFHQGVEISLGRFDTPEEASRVYLEAKRKLHAASTI